MSDYYKIRLRRFSSDSGFTGQARDLRFRDLPDSLSPQEKQAIRNQDDSENVYGPQFLEEVIFDVSPTVSESRAANYADEALPGPVGLVVYQTTNNRRFNISGRFVSRTVREALLNYFSVNLLRSWMIPQDDEGISGSAGRPPILRLNGYKNQFFNIPTVISDLNISYPEDVDYIETEIAMVPIVQTVELNLIESHAVNAIRIQTEQVTDIDASDFNLRLFKTGQLPGY